MMPMMYTLLMVVTARESNPKHQELVNEVMTLPSIKKVVEHPDLFVVKQRLVQWKILTILSN